MDARAATVRSAHVFGDATLSESQSIHLAADLSFLHTDYLWRMPGSWVGYPYYGTSELYEDIAKGDRKSVV